MIMTGLEPRKFIDNNYHCRSQLELVGINQSKSQEQICKFLLYYWCLKKAWLIKNNQKLEIYNYSHTNSYFFNTAQKSRRIMLFLCLFGSYSINKIITFCALSLNN